MKVEYHPLTISDINEAVKHYNNQQSNLGNDYRAEVYAAIKRVRENPYLYAEVLGVRRTLVKRFPYSVVFRVLDDEVIRFLLIRHHSRHEDHASKRQ